MSAFLEVGKSMLGCWKKRAWRKMLPRRVDNVPRLLSIQGTGHTGTFNATHPEACDEIEQGKEQERTQQSKKLEFSLHKMLCRVTGPRHQSHQPYIKSDRSCILND